VHFKPGLDPRLEHTILRALAKDPNERFQTALQLFGALDGSILGVPLPPASGLAMRRNRFSLAGELRRASRIALYGLAGALLCLALLWISGGPFWLVGRRGIAPGRAGSQIAPQLGAESAGARKMTTDGDFRKGDGSAGAADPLNSLNSAPSGWAADPSSESVGAPAFRSRATPITLGRAKRPVTPEIGAGRQPPLKTQPGRLEGDISPGLAAPETFDSLIVEGDIQCLANRYAAALTFYSKAYRLNPRNASVRQKLHDVLRLLGRTEEADRYR